MAVREILLICDEDDWDAIQAEFARRQAHRMDDGNGGTQPILPDGESNLAGAIVGEMARDLEDYRDFYDEQHPTQEPPDAPR